MWPLFLLLLFPASYLSAQVRPSAPANTLIADMQQDILSLKQQMGEMRLQVESLERENRQLRERLSNVDQELASRVTLAFFQTESRKLSLEIQKGLEGLKSELVRILGERVESVARQDRLSRGSTTSDSPAVEFSDDYPRDGIMYTVRSGDTLSGIAQKTGSTITDIRNANQIVDPTRLQVGQKLFIPLENE